MKLRGAAQCSIMMQRVPEQKDPAFCSVFDCAPPIQRPRLIWLIPLVFSALWMAVVVGVIVNIVLPELDCSIPAVVVAGCGALLWLLLVLCVRSSVRRINNVVQLTCEEKTLSILLSNQVCHRYLFDGTTIRVRRAKNIRDSSPLKHKHFRMFVTHGHRTVCYNILVENVDHFFSYLSCLQNRLKR